MLERGRLRLDSARHEAFWDGKPVPLTVTEFAILRAMAAHPGRVYTRDLLMDLAYPDRRVVSDRTIDSHVRHLRAKFQAAGGEPIATAHGLGYRFAEDPGSTHMTRWPWRKPRIRTALLAVNLFLLSLPLAGIGVLRLYESALVRQTELELIAQGAVIGAAYKAAWLRAAASDDPTLARSLQALPLAPPRSGRDVHWTPRFAALDLADDPVLEPPPGAARGPAAEVFAARAGETLQPVLSDAQRVTLAGMRVLDAQGVVVATSREELGLSLAAFPEVASALGGHATSTIRRRAPGSEAAALLGSISRGALIRVFVALPVVEHGRVLGAVMLSRTPASIEQALYGKRWHLAGLALLLLGAGTAAALFTGYTIGRPIRAVAAQAKAVAAGARVSMTRTRRSAVREADELWESIAAMAETLEQRADYIRGFAAEVSHEFKTPLAAIRGALEVVRDHADSMTREERDRFLGNAAADVDRLDRLVGPLLELARAEAPMMRGHVTEVGTAARTVAAPFQAAGLPLRLEGPDVPVYAGISSEALHAILENLFDNIRQHAGPGAAGTVVWCADPERRQATIEVSDTGKGSRPATPDASSTASSPRRASPAAQAWACHRAQPARRRGRHDRTRADRGGSRIRDPAPERRRVHAAVTVSDRRRARPRDAARRHRTRTSAAAAAPTASSTVTR